MGAGASFSAMPIGEKSIDGGPVITPLPSPGKGGSFPVMPYPETPFPPQRQPTPTGYFSGSMRPPMGYYQAPNRPYGGGKGGGLPPFAVPMSGYGMGGFGSPFGMAQPQPIFNQGPFGGGQFRRGFGSYGHMGMSGTGPGSQMYGVQNRLPSIYQGPMNQGPFPQIANAYQGPINRPQFMTQDVVRPSAQEAYKQAQIEAKDARASGMMGRVVLPGEQSFEDFEKNYNFRPQGALLQQGGFQPLRGALGGLGSLARGVFR